MITSNKMQMQKSLSGDKTCNENSKIYKNIFFLSFNNLGRCNNGIMHFLDSLCNKCLFTSERCPDPVVDNRQSVTLYACH